MPFAHTLPARTANRCERATGIGRRWLIAASVVVTAGLTGCSAGEPSDADAAGDYAPDQDLAFGDLVPEDDASGEETFEFDPPEPEREPLSAEEIADFELPPVPAPDDVPSGADGARADSISAAATSPEVDILAAAAIDQTPTDDEIASYGDGLQRTATGRLIVLDEPASVACANIEMAIWAVDAGDAAGADERLSTAVDEAGRSTSEGVQTWLPSLEAELTDDRAIDPLVLVGFLEACVAGGHEL